jgi:plasmid stabilization system protein ParE
MLALRQHPLLNADLPAAFDWYEEQRLGLGWEFKDDFLAHFRNLPRDAQLYGIGFADVRRLNLDRFPYGLFYVIRAPEIWLLAVLHASRDTETVLAERRWHFRG